METIKSELLAILRDNRNLSYEEFRSFVKSDDGDRLRTLISDYDPNKEVFELGAIEDLDMANNEYWMLKNCYVKMQQYEKAAMLRSFEKEIEDALKK